MRGSSRSFCSRHKLLQIVDGGDLVMFEKQRDALRTEALDFQELQRGRRELPSSTSRRSQVPWSSISASTTARPLPMPGMSVTLRSGFLRISATARDSLRWRWRRCDSCGCGRSLRPRSPSGRRFPRGCWRSLCSPSDDYFSYCGAGSCLRGLASFARPRRLRSSPPSFARPRRLRSSPPSFARPRRLLVPAGFARPRRLRSSPPASLVPAELRSSWTGREACPTGPLPLLSCALRPGCPSAHSCLHGKHIRRSDQASLETDTQRSTAG